MPTFQTLGLQSRSRQSHFSVMQNRMTLAGNRSKAVADKLKIFLGQVVRLTDAEEKFKHQIDGQGNTISLCLACCEIVGRCANDAEIEAAESAHECQVEIAQA
jgi:hypothetical protein